MMSRTSSGVDLYKRLSSSELRQTLLPLPVVPAMSICGSFRDVADDAFAGDVLAYGEG